MNRFTKRREPFRFMLWLGISGSVLLFTVLLAIYVVRRTAADWRDVPLPVEFLLSTFVIVLSSFTLRNANGAFRREQFAAWRSNMALTLLLGTLFMALQTWGWWELLRGGIGLGGNPSGSFVYLLSGLHLLHILIGLIFLGMTLAEALRRRAYVESFVYSVNPPNQLKLRLITLYWHFVDILWLVLFAFLLVHHPIHLGIKF